MNTARMMPRDKEYKVGIRIDCIKPIRTVRKSPMLWDTACWYVDLYCRRYSWQYKFVEFDEDQQEFRIQELELEVE